VDPEVMRQRLAEARVGYLATVRAAAMPRAARADAPSGDVEVAPHVVPCCFALDDEAAHLYTLVDEVKPKRTRALQRLANVRAHPRASLVVDHYDDEDWTQLWWVRVDGRARVVDQGPEHLRAAELLAAKYAPYRDDASRPPPGAALVIDLDRWAAWP
jgi:PPOX class probable F420-dependent enzyme